MSKTNLNTSVDNVFVGLGVTKLFVFTVDTALLVNFPEFSGTASEIAQRSEKTGGVAEVANAGDVGKMRCQDQVLRWHELCNVVPGHKQYRECRLPKERIKESGRLRDAQGDFGKTSNTLLMLIFLRGGIPVAKGPIEVAKLHSRVCVAEESHDAHCTTTQSTNAASPV